tara:strand:- start:777 stop:1520 length:744 start_codon:yes stop_codon:yes gene_type:complete
MKNKFLKKIIGLFGYKLVEKDLIKNQRELSDGTMLNMKNFLDYYFDQNNISNLIQIGANDGKRHDHLNYFIKKFKINSVLVEPITDCFNELKKNYLDYNFVKLENSAIGVNNELSYLFQVNKKGLNFYHDDIKGLNSFDINHLLKHGVKKKHINKTKISSISILELIRKYNINQLDLLCVDTEGYDDKIVNEFLISTNLKPLIIFEYIHIKNKSLKELLNLLNTKNYKFFSIKEDLICFPSDKKFLF